MSHPEKLKIDGGAKTFFNRKTERMGKSNEKSVLPISKNGILGGPISHLQRVKSYLNDYKKGRLESTLGLPALRFLSADTEISDERRSRGMPASQPLPNEVLQDGVVPERSRWPPQKKIRATRSCHSKLKQNEF